MPSMVSFAANLGLAVLQRLVMAFSVVGVLMGNWLCCTDTSSRV
jgi:hypothetical protein